MPSCPPSTTHLLRAHVHAVTPSLQHPPALGSRSCPRSLLPSPLPCLPCRLSRRHRCLAACPARTPAHRATAPRCKQDGAPQQSITIGPQDGAPQQSTIIGPQDGAPQQSITIGPQDRAPQQTTIIGPQDGAPQQSIILGPQDRAPQQSTIIGAQDGALQQSTILGPPVQVNWMDNASPASLS